MKINYTAAEIENLLGSVASKLDGTNVATSLDETAPEKTLPSIGLVRAVNEKFDSLSDPDVFEGLFRNIPNADIFTQVDREKFEAQNLSSFKGVFANAALRASALNTVDFAGGEITFLIDNGVGLQSWDYWDKTSGVWKTGRLVSGGSIGTLEVPTQGTVVYTALDTTKFKTAAIMLSATKAGGQYHALTTLIGTNGTDSYYTVYGDLGNTDLVTVATAMNGTSLEFRVTTLASEVTLKASKFAEM